MSILRNQFIGLLLLCVVVLTIWKPSNAFAVETSTSGWKDIAVGGRISLGVKQDGSVWAWGETNRSGAFGNGDRSSENPMVPVRVSSLQNIAVIAAGADHALALQRDGSVWAWGSNLEGQIGDDNRTILQSGKAYEVIENNDHSLPYRVQNIPKAVAIAGGWSQSLAVMENGSLWAWGSAAGVNPVPYEGFSDIIAVSTGYTSAIIALKKDGTVWRLTRHGVTKVAGLTDIVQVAEASGDAYALKKDGTVWVFGNYVETSVNGRTVMQEGPAIKVEGIEDVISVQGTTGGPLYLKKNGTVWASGRNSGGQLGIGTYEDSKEPVQVKGLQKIVKIAAHGTGFRSLALREDGVLFSWGGGFTGDGTPWYRTEPVWIKHSENEVYEATLISVELNGQRLEFDQSPIIVEGSTLVPFRKIFEAIGANVEWVESTSTAVARKGQTTLQLTIGNLEAFVDNETVNLESAPIIRNGNTLVPLRFISESLGAQVFWEDESKTVKITTEKN